MDERTLIGRIDALVAEEHALRRHGEAISEEDRDRLRELEEHLDQLWDLMRRRRAAVEAGADPDGVAARPVDEVERYLQ